MSVWISQHIQAFQQVIRRCAGDSWHTLFISLVIGVALTLPVLGYVVTQNLGDLAGQTRHEAQVSLFLQPGLSDEAITNIQHALEKNPVIKSVTFVSKAQALEQLENSFADATLIESLQQNPLPDAFQLEPNSLESASLAGLKSQLQSMNGVQEVVLDSEWLNRLNSITQLAKRIVWLLAGLFALLLVSVISNTVRMQILSQREEIELSQLIGATAAFTRRPFLYLGGLYGLLGGVLAILLAALAVYLFNRSVAPLAAAYHSDFSMGYPDILITLTTCLLAAGIGLVAAHITATRHIAKHMQ